MKTYLIIIAIAGVVLSIAGFVLGSWYGPKTDPNAVIPSSVPQPPAIDEHGCEVASGFVWCEPKNKCLQLWDEKCEGVVPASESGSTNT